MPAVVLNWSDPPPAGFTGGAVTVGNFDGVHLGHRELIDATVRRAKAVGGPAVAVTFDPPPIHLLNPASIKPPLTTVEDRAELLLAAGATHVVTLRVDAGLLALSPEAFFEDVLVGQFRAKAVVEGYNFRFGQRRAGDNILLKKLCEKVGIGFEEVPPRELGGEAVSSSRVRAELNAGNVAGAAKLLDRPYAIRGTVVAGAKRGRTLGFPTANLDDVPTLVPGTGVYAVRARVGGQSWPAAANVGGNPTFGEDARKIEVHLIGFDGDLYGEDVRVEFVAKLRDTKPFAGVEALKEQLDRDIREAKSLLS
jgi:riboflavin kinase/FMN adenylyltransferase